MYELRAARYAFPSIFGQTRDFSALYVGNSGDVILQQRNPQEGQREELGPLITFRAVPVGILWVSGARIEISGTTATDIVCLVF